MVEETAESTTQAVIGFVEKIVKLYQDAGATNIDTVSQSFNALGDTIAGALNDGFQFEDIPTILAAVVDQLAAIAEGGITGGANKKAFVVSAGTAAYELLDKGSDGTKNRIDIPYLPQLIETQVERFGVPFLLSLLVEGVVAGYNRIKK